MSAESKINYLIAYDYGMGGIWGVMFARSEADIAAVYPELIIVNQRPEWMTEPRYSELLGAPYDIDGAPWGLLNAVLADRKRE